MEKKDKYNWQYCSVGGVVRVKIASGEDLAHLGELDQKLWTVLSCPTKGLEFDSKTLELLDTDADGKIRVPEVVSAAEWLTSVIKDRDSILEGRKALPLALIDTGNEAGQKLHDSAKRVLEYLGLDKEEVALEDIEDTTNDMCVITKGVVMDWCLNQGNTDLIAHIRKMIGIYVDSLLTPAYYQHFGKTTPNA